MRTTLDIEDDVLEMAKGVARHQCLSLGKAVSLLIRRGIHPPEQKKIIRNGLRVITRTDGDSPVTMEIVNRLRDE